MTQEVDHFGLEVEKQAGKAKREEFSEQSKGMRFHLFANGFASVNQ